MSITNLSLFLPESEIDPAMATDTEVNAAFAAHAASVNPHPQYQLQLPVTTIQQSVPAPAQITIPANTWFDLGNWNQLNSGASESLFAMSLYLQYISGGQTQPYWQYSGAALISPNWWKASGAQLVKYIDLEGHAATDITISFRLGLTGQGSRMVQLFFPFAVSARLVRASFVRFFG